MIFISGGRGKKKHQGYHQGKGGCAKVIPKCKREKRAKSITMKNRSYLLPKDVVDSPKDMDSSSLEAFIARLDRIWEKPGLMKGIPNHGKKVGTR